MEPLRVGISACLLGQPVRYDGRDKRSAFLIEALGPHVSYVPVCPEVEVGMGVPRETVALIRRDDGDRVAMLGTESRRDFTAAMTVYADARVEALASAGLCGYVLKARSPSCGLGSVPITGAPAAEVFQGDGLFARALRRRLPTLPVVEETALDEPAARDAFLSALFAHQRLRALWAGQHALHALVAFHTRHKMLLLAHDERGYRALGRLVAQAAALPVDVLRARYEAEFLGILARPSTIGGHTNALEHLAGHCTRVLSAQERAQLHNAIAEFRQGVRPRFSVIQLLRNHAHVHDLPYLRNQLYLSAYPEPLFSDV